MRNGTFAPAALFIRACRNQRMAVMIGNSGRHIHPGGSDLENAQNWLWNDKRNDGMSF